MLDTLRSVIRFRRFDPDPVSRRLRRAVSVSDLRRIARRRLPRGVFDYIDGGAEDERTLAANTAAFGSIGFRPRVLRDVGGADASTRLLGRVLPFPVVLAPTGCTRMVDPQGESAVARAAARVGVPYTLSTFASRSMEEIAAVSGGPRWFQIYIWKDRDLVRRLIERAAEAGYDALVVTVDTAVFGRRERDLRRGFSLPPRLGPGTLIDGLLHPRWTWSLLTSEPIAFRNLAAEGVGGSTGVAAAADQLNAQFDPRLSWDDLDRIRGLWDGPLVVKGIQTVEDARLAAERGADAIALSNHGGRQLDSAPVPVELVAPVVDAIGDRCEVICDGGVRRGSDVVKAVALGARACMVGRPYLYALAVGGERGVEHVLELLGSGVRRTLALIGAKAITDVTPDSVVVRGGLR